MTSSYLSNGKGGTFAAPFRSKPPGVPGAANGRFYNGDALKGQLFVSRAFLGLFVAELGLKRVNASFQGLILLARQTGHFLGRLEFLALDHIKIAQNSLGLG